jgi:hypothetical protein
MAIPGTFPPELKRLKCDRTRFKTGDMVWQLPGDQVLWQSQARKVFI